MARDINAIGQYLHLGLIICGLGLQSLVLSQTVQLTVWSSLWCPRPNRVWRVHLYCIQIQADTFMWPDDLLYTLVKVLLNAGLEISLPSYIIWILVRNNSKAVSGAQWQGIPIPLFMSFLQLHSRMLWNSLRIAKNRQSLLAWGQKETSSQEYVIICLSCVFFWHRWCYHW